jgi:dipeptidase E
VQRIREPCALYVDAWIAGLREGTAFRVENGSIEQLGGAQRRVFRSGRAPGESSVGVDFSFLLDPMGEPPASVPGAWS